MVCTDAVSAGSLGNFYTPFDHFGLSVYCHFRSLAHVPAVFVHQLLYLILEGTKSLGPVDVVWPTGVKAGCLPAKVICIWGFLTSF